MNIRFLKELYRAGKAIERTTGIPTIFIVAQAVQEQGWNVTPIRGSNNIYGIKYHIKKWGYVTAPTLEEYGGKKHKVIARFQKYPTLQDCIQDHTTLLLSDIKGSNAELTYRECLENYKRNKDYNGYVRCVAKSYATDTGYASHILNITEVLNEMGINEPNEYQNEVEKAKATMAEYGIMKPYGADYWTQGRTEAAVRLYRLLGKLQITLKGGVK